MMIWRKKKALLMWKERWMMTKKSLLGDLIILVWEMMSMRMERRSVITACLSQVGLLV
jgi:hypothetical protein